MDMLTLMAVAAAEPDRGTEWRGLGSVDNTVHECAACALEFAESAQVTQSYRADVLACTVFLVDHERRKCRLCRCKLITTPMEG